MRGGRLLVLDDDEAVGLILVMGAQATGFEARLCLNAASFFDQLMPWAPTHVAVDLTMPDITAADVLIRLAGTGHRPQLIVCSGADPQRIDEARRHAEELGLGTPQVLAKPFSLASLRRLIAAPAAS
jgi:DNA-binding response OmpR family regulator